MKFIIFTAPSGAGKTTIIHRIVKRDARLVFSVSACTRAKRAHEIDGIDYYFLTVEEFKEKIENGEFLEWEEVYPGVFYGTLLTEIERIAKEEKVAVFDIDVKGAYNIKLKFKEKALTIYVKAPSFDELKRRLGNRRSETEESLQKRFEKMQYEMSFENFFDKVIVNDDLDVAVKQAQEAIEKFLENGKTFF